jgi:CSLREA domain-containing protein
LTVSLDTDGAVVAVLPLRLNADALSDLVVLKDGSTAPSVVLTAPMATLVVNSTADTDDGACTSTPGGCTLREAINAANGAPGMDTIEFDIPGSGPHTIQPGSALPVITEPVVIDATMESGCGGPHCVELDGSMAESTADGLRITGGSSTVRGLVINRFRDNGIDLSTNGGNLLESNFIGTDVAGTAALGNNADGVFINGAPGNTIGGTAADTENVISGNTGRGVFISGSGAAMNQVQGNFIGTDKSGAVALGNFNRGVFIDGAPNNTIGGPAAGAGNVISGNNGNGVLISGGGAAMNQVQGNFIGTNATGTADRGNSGNGVFISGAPGNTIGGTAAGAGNVISGNSGNGVEINSSGATMNQVQGNVIGTNAAGTADLGNSGNGVLISGAPGNTIGGTAAGAGNVISGNDQLGVGISGVASTGNKVQGNLIGTNAAGSADLGNSGDGVLINGAPGNTIGGPAAGAGNVISGNDEHGVEINGVASTGNQMQGNLIGTDAAGTADLGNTSNGVFIFGAPGNTIGGAAAGAGNVISGNNTNGIEINGVASTGNQVQGNFIGTDAAGAVALGNSGRGVFIFGAPNNLIGGTAAGARNVISGNNVNGVLILDSGAAMNQVQGNFIGTDVTGRLDRGNTLDGVSIAGAPNNTIGGTAAGAGNLISGNDGNGVAISSSTGNQVQGNLIGTDATGTADLGNTGDGVSISGSPNNAIGGMVAGAGNVISGNNGSGVLISGGGATMNQVQGNFIGTDAAGSADLGNTSNGVFISGAPGNTIGGTAAGARNVISGNNGSGVFINGTGATMNQVQGNVIGANAAGTADVGNTGDGVLISGAPDNTIGGTAAGAGNVISGNDGLGVGINGIASTGNQVQGNFIGTDVTATVDLGNSGHGVAIVGAPDNTIGGTAAGAGNTVAFNGGDGVTVVSGLVTNAIRRNSIFSNGGLGINLGTDGVTANDLGDIDIGPNNLQNFPVLALAISNGGITTVTGSLNSAANTAFTLEFFSEPACDPSGHGEGKTFLGAAVVTTNSINIATFGVAFPALVTSGQNITATATDPANNTSEFSACVGVLNQPPDAVNDTATTAEDTPVVINVLGNDSDPDGGTLLITAVSDPPNGTAVNNGDGTVTYTPDTNFNGTDVFTYTVTDGQDGSSTANVSVTVGSQNDLPTANDDTAGTVEDTPVVINVLSNDSDPDGGTLSVSAVSDPPNGTAVNNGDGTVTYTPDANFNGTDAFSYTLSDGQGGSDTATVTVTVISQNDPPVAVTDAATTDEDTPVTISVLANDSDTEGQPLTITTVSDPAHGTAVRVNSNTKVRYTPDANFNGTDTFTYTLSDGQGGTATATVTVTVNSINDPPEAVNDGAITDENTPVTINVLDNDSDPEGHPLTVSAVTSPAHGTVMNLGGGLLKYTPNRNFSGTDMFSYTLSDGQGGTDTAMVAVLVNDVLVLRDDRNGNCLRINLGTNTYLYKTASNGTYTGPAIITVNGDQINFQSGPGDPNLLTGGVSLFRFTGTARYLAPRNNSGRLYTITDSDIRDSEECP